MDALSKSKYLSSFILNMYSIFMEILIAEFYLMCTMCSKMSSLENIER